MGLQPNTTCDIYRAGNSPPSAPNEAGVKCHLRPDFLRGLEAGEGEAAAFRWTHILTVDASVEVIDGYDAGTSDNGEDTIYIPGQGGTGFKVKFVDDLNEGAGAVKTVYVARLAPPWPTKEL